MVSQPFFGKLSPLSQFLMFMMVIMVCALLTVLLSYLVATILWGSDALNSISNASDGNLNLMRTVQVMSQVGIFILPPLLFAWLTQPMPLKALGLNKPLPRQIILALLIMPVAGPMINELVAWNEAIRLPQSLHGLEQWMKASEENAARLTENFLKPPGWGTLWVNVVMIALLPAIGEELLFRSVLIGLFRKIFKNVHWPIIISSLIFSAIHMQFYGFIPRFVLGMVLGYLFVWSGSVWLPMIAHFINNVSVVIVSFLFYNNYTTTSAESFGTGMSWPWVMLSAILSLVILLLVRKKDSGKLSGYWGTS